jgi:hypothetical protein
MKLWANVRMSRHRWGRTFDDTLSIVMVIFPGKKRMRASESQGRRLAAPKTKAQSQKLTFRHPKRIDSGLYRYGRAT